MSCLKCTAVKELNKYLGGGGEGGREQDGRGGERSLLDLRINTRTRVLGRLGQNGGLLSTHALNSASV